MLSNLHTHTLYCDGKNTTEEMLLSAIDMGFKSIGFSGHGFTDFDHSYCMTDTERYIAEVNALKEKYKSKIQIYLGVEEDAFCPVDRSKFDYVIGSSHYLVVGDDYLPVDCSPRSFDECFDAFGDAVALAQTYYSSFCEYILKYKPDIVGHFDLITKYDQMEGQSRFLANSAYMDIAERYLKVAMKSGAIFELNTGAMARGYRTTPYPQENLLHVLKKEDARIILSSDSHSVDTLCFGFDDARVFLKEIGFQYVYVLYDGEFKKDYL